MLTGKYLEYSEDITEKEYEKICNILREEGYGSENYSNKELWIQFSGVYPILTYATAPKCFGNYSKEAINIKDITINKEDILYNVPFKGMIKVTDITYPYKESLEKFFSQFGDIIDLGHVRFANLNSFYFLERDFSGKLKLAFTELPTYKYGYYMTTLEDSQKIYKASEVPCKIAILVEDKRHNGIVKDFFRPYLKEDALDAWVYDGVGNYYYLYIDNEQGLCVKVGSQEPNGYKILKSSGLRIKKILEKVDEVEKSYKYAIKVTDYNQKDLIYNFFKQFISEKYLAGWSFDIINNFYYIIQNFGDLIIGFSPSPPNGYTLINAEDLIPEEEKQKPEDSLSAPQELKEASSSKLLGPEFKIEDYFPQVEEIL